MTTGCMYLWRFKKDGGIYRFCWVDERKGDMLKLGSYNGDTHGVWVKESEVEYEKYR